MSRSINKVTLLGNLTRDPELRNTKTGKAVCDFTLATNRSFIDDQGARNELAEFHHIVAWGKLAEIAGKYLVKGSRVLVEGRLQTRDYETPDGQKKSKTEIVINDLVLIDMKALSATDAPQTTNGSATEDADDLSDLHGSDEDANSETMPN
jgi:single-strand DNA-binding protein